MSRTHELAEDPRLCMRDLATNSRELGEKSFPRTGGGPHAEALGLGLWLTRQSRFGHCGRGCRSCRRFWCRGVTLSLRRSLPSECAAEADSLGYLKRAVMSHPRPAPYGGRSVDGR